MAKELRRTPLFSTCKALGGRMVPFAGYEMAVQFAGVKSEHLAVRQQAGLFDVSHMGEFWIEGANAVDFADHLVANDVKKLAPGRICYATLCAENGGIVDDLLVYKITDQKILLVVNASRKDADFEHIQSLIKGNVTVVDKSDQTGQVALQGPLAEQVLARLEGEKYKALKPFSFVEDTVCDIPCIVSRTGYTGEDGYEIYCDGAKIADIYEQLMKAGQPLGLVPVGLGARDTLRLESKLTLYGNDIDLTTTPLEASLGWTVKFTDDDFVGKQALLAQKTAGITRKLVGFEMIGKGIARHGYAIIPAGAGADAQPISTVTSGSPAPLLNKNIGLAYLPIDLCKVGTTFGVVVRKKVIEAKVVKTPFYKKHLKKR